MAMPVCVVPDSALPTKPMAPSSMGRARCQRRSRRRSALRPSRGMQIAAARYGMAVKTPMLKTPLIPAVLIRVGNQKVNPYWPMTQQK